MPQNKQMPVARKGQLNRCPFPLPSHQNSASRRSRPPDLLILRLTAIEAWRVNPLSHEATNRANEGRCAAQGRDTWAVIVNHLVPAPSINMPLCGKMKFSLNPRTRGSSNGNIWNFKLCTLNWTRWTLLRGLQNALRGLSLVKFRRSSLSAIVS